MIARAITASLALLAIAGAAYAQDAVIYVNASNQTTHTHERQVAMNELESIVNELQLAKADALALYTDYASRAGNDMRTFLQNMTGFAENVIQNLHCDPPPNDPNQCWMKFGYRIKKIEHDARRAAVYSGDCHHKFLLGHMIVFRMHLNKSEDYLKRCDRITRGCGLPCETTPRVKRWRRLAMEEVHRVRQDIPFTTRSYRDVVSHARRKLNHLKKQALSKARIAVEDYKYCVTGARRP